MTHNAWFQRLPELLVGALEKKVLDTLLQKTSGTRLVQIGGPNPDFWLSAARFAHVFWVDPFFHGNHAHLLIQAQYGALPIQTESIDTVFLFHVVGQQLDLSALLDEVTRILKPGGQCIVMDLNRWSVWQLMQMKKQPCYSVFKIKKQLRQRDFGITFSTTFCFQSPFFLAKENRFSLLMETIGQLLFSSFGAAFMVTAVKKVPGMTPIAATPWKKKELMPRNARWEPSTRGVSSCKKKPHQL